MARTFALIARVQYVLQQVSCSYETIPNAHKYYKMHWNISFGSNGVDQCVRCEKLQHEFVARTFELIEPVQYVLHQVSWCYETIPNAPKHYETHQNMSLVSNGVHQVRWLRKITSWHRGTNFCINCTSSVCFAISFMKLRKRSQMHTNTLKHTKIWG